MDGFGLRQETEGNAIRAAATPRLDQFFREYAHTTLRASGLDVGLPDGQMGNSEVGHTNIGAGRVVFQDLPRITKAIADGSFDENPAYRHAMDACLEKGTSLHLMGLLSDGGVHSHLEHLFALLRLAKRRGLEHVYLHAFLDGRDVSPTSGADFVAQTVAQCREIGVGKIATVMGRYYAMDRDKRWDRVEAAYDAMVYGEGAVQNPDPVAAVRESYDRGVTDEFVEPVVCDAEGTISDNDSVIFFNFRPDRARLHPPVFPRDLRVQHRVRRLHAQCGGGLPPGDGAQWPGGVSQPDGHDPAADRGDGEVRPCDLLLQRRVRDCVSR